jgi:hypothetical protein
MTMDALVKWIVILGVVVAVPVLRNAIHALEARQDKAWAERDEMIHAIMGINDKLKVRPDQVMEEIKAMRQEHHEMRALISPEAREAWHQMLHSKPTVRASN